MGQDLIDLSKIKVGQEILVNGKRYARCADCKKIVCLNKTFFGDLHLCV